MNIITIDDNALLLDGFRLSEIYDGRPDSIVINISNIEKLSNDQLLTLEKLKSGLPVSVRRKYRQPEEVIFNSRVIFNFDKKTVKKVVEDLVMAETQLVIKPNDETLLNAEKCRATFKKYLNML